MTAPTQSLTRELVEAISAITVTALSAEDLRAIRSLFLDFIGVAVNGSTTDSAAIYNEALRALPLPGGPGLAVIGTGTQMPAVAAAMANALASHSIEYDDVHNTSSLHPAVVVFPAVLAAIALDGTIDADDAFLRGVVAGYEVMCRVGTAANPPAHYGRNFHPTGTAGALGAAAAVSAVFDLDVTATVHALGIATTMASGNMEFLADGAWTKRLNPALAARAGLESAVLARAGFTGPLDGIAGDRGFLHAFSGHARPELLMQGWGEMPLAVEATSIKAHTCCRYNQGPIDAVLALRAQHGLTLADVRSITIGLPTVAVDIVAEPAAAKRRPMSVVDAQFSVPFGVAVALVHGRAGLAEYQDDVLVDADVRAAMDLVGYQVDPTIDRDYPTKWRAWARIETTNGRTFEASVDDPKGDPANPLTPDELRAKFRALTTEIYTPERQSRLEDLVAALGVRPVLGELLPELAAP